MSLRWNQLNNDNAEIIREKVVLPYEQHTQHIKETLQSGDNHEQAFTNQELKDLKLKTSYVHYDHNWDHIKDMELQIQATQEQLDKLALSNSIRRTNFQKKRESSDAVELLLKSQQIVFGLQKK
eukprot:EST42168.1 Hypothetical protein SS50377_18476 [Spironucleus salmonicida]